MQFRFFQHRDTEYSVSQREMNAFVKIVVTYKKVTYKKVTYYFVS